MRPPATGLSQQLVSFVGVLSLKPPQAKFYEGPGTLTGSTPPHWRPHAFGLRRRVLSATAYDKHDDDGALLCVSSAAVCEIRAGDARATRCI